MQPRITDQLEDFIWDYLDGTLPADEVAILVSWLQEDRENIRTYLLLASVHRHIKEILREGVAAENIFLSLSDSNDLQIVESGDIQLFDDPMLYAAKPRRRLFLGHPLFVGTLAASLITIIFALSGMLQWPGRNLELLADKPVMEEGVSQEQSTSGDLEPLTAATVTGLLDAQWSDDSHSASYGEPLLEGRKLKLSQGLAQLTFESGVKLLLQAPAELTVDTEMNSQLDAGKITAVVPRRASGFAIRTPNAEVIDIGTEFAVHVDELGGSEVHVFDGEVISQGLDQAGERIGELLQVTQRKAVKYAPGTTTVRTINYNGAKFRRELEPRLTNDELPPLSVKRDLALWLSADDVVKLDENDRVIAWRDILTGDNQTAEDALQFMPELRPRWIEKSINNRAAIRFNGKTLLITTPMETTDDQTVSLVFQLNQKAVRRTDKGGQILNYNGPPQRHITNPSQPGVLQIGDYKATKNKSPLFSAFVYSSRGGAGIRSGSVTSSAFHADEPVVLTYVYDRTNKKARMFINGRLQGANIASALPAITSRKVIGRHGKYEDYFIGDLAELLIYNTALSNQERKAVDTYLMQRYGIGNNDASKLIEADQISL
ncbi:MAG: FecR domain-containing protein [Pirellulales bacterium]|nr:FecR domain-containing protein [Pirellulales bacterium]